MHKDGTWHTFFVNGDIVNMYGFASQMGSVTTAQGGCWDKTEVKTIHKRAQLCSNKTLLTNQVDSWDLPRVKLAVCITENRTKRHLQSE